MMKRTHLFAGLAVTLPFITWENIMLLPLAILGAIAPDFDYILGIEHRTITHSLVALEISTTLFCLYDLQFGLVWGLNYASHLLLDSFSKTGVPLFYPWNKKCYGKRLFYTKGVEDGLLCMMLIYVIATSL